jgi:hypothetical protein
MLCKEKTAMHSENFTKHINTLRGQNAEFVLSVKRGGTHTNHCALKG